MAEVERRLPVNLQDEVKCSPKNDGDGSSSEISDSEVNEVSNE